MPKAAVIKACIDRALPGIFQDMNARLDQFPYSPAAKAGKHDSQAQQSAVCSADGKAIGGQAEGLATEVQNTTAKRTEQVTEEENPDTKPAWPRGALKRTEAARYLGIGITKLWHLVSLGKIRQTSYGTYSIEELDRHLRDETENKGSRA